MKTNPNDLTKEEVVTIAKQAYTFGYPLLMMDTTKNVQTNVEKPENGHAPLNQVGKAQTFPTYETKDVVKPNVDTFYNLLWMDLKEGPIVVSVPYTNQYIYNNGASGSRYSVFPFLDAYSNVFNSSGTRITGSEPLLLFVYGPDYDAETLGIPANMDGVKAPTNMVWMLGRIQTNSEEDAQNFVWPIQRQIMSIPYANWFDVDYVAPSGSESPDLDHVEPVSAVLGMHISNYFNLMTTLMDENPPAEEDSEMINLMASIGIVAGNEFDLSTFTDETIAALEDIPNNILNDWSIKMAIKIKENDENINNWVNIKSNMGNFGTDYVQRAFIAYKGLGANLIEDAMYPNCQLDEQGAPLDSSKNYIMTFDEEPPVGAFWSITCYNADNFLVENSANKYCVGSISGEIEKRTDGSFDIFISNQPPSSGQSNWLPTPASGAMSLTMRLYLPNEEILSSEWNPPAVRINS